MSGITRLTGPELPAGMATLAAEAAAEGLRIPARVLFPRPNATLAAPNPLEQVARALRNRAGLVQVLAYTDSKPTHTVAFPSNFALSVGRAKAVRTSTNSSRTIRMISSREPRIARCLVTAGSEA